MADGAVTQPTQPATQLASQYDDADESDVWGVLIPCNPNNVNVSRINFHKSKLEYTIGRGSSNDIHFPKCMLISTNHCTIKWDGDESAKSAVILTDTSTNGTFIDGHRLAAGSQGKWKILTDGCEIGFGSYVAHQPNKALDDYRFIFRHKASRAPALGLDKTYDLQHVLGRGSFGTVMKALHKEEGTWYAVKIIPARKLRKGMMDSTTNVLSPETIPSALRREIQIMQRLEHRNICQFKEVFYETQGISIVLEWVRGGDLLEYLETHGGLTEATAQYLTYQICDALAYLHSLGIAHRDLKPENILLTDDNPPMVKIADFGLAKVVDTLTVLHTFCGTPAYLAPEIVDGGDGYDHVIDSWSVGVIVYSMITMCTPFCEEPETMDVPRRVTSRKVEWCILQDKNASEQCENFVRCLLQEDPKQRMTLTDARNHPWLADQAHLHLSGGSQGSLGPSQQSLVTPPSQPSQSLLPDASMRSFVSDPMALDTASIVMDEAYEQGGDDRNMTPSVAMIDDASRRSLTRSVALPGHPASLQRRADVIRQAYNIGVELRVPSQEMRPSAADGDRAEGAEAPGPLAYVAATDVAQSQRAAPSRASKRKAVDLSPEPSSPPSVCGASENTTTTNAQAAPHGVDDGRSPERGGRRFSQSSPKRPAAKKPRIQATALQSPGDAGKEQRGLNLARRRSKRLHSPSRSMHNPARKT